MALPTEREVTKVIINYEHKSIAVQYREYIVDDDGSRYIKCSCQCAFMPGQHAEMDDFVGTQLPPEVKQLRRSMWTQDVIDAYIAKQAEQDV